VSFLATIDREAAAKKLRYLVIGGLAVNFYGYSRDTSDLDFFISQNDRAEWMNLLVNFGYKNFHDGGSFIQYQAPEKNAWPVDLMLVQEKTFTPILGACVDADLFGVKTRVPSLEHLIVLKLHALKNTRTQRFLKDFLDVENLIRINRLDIKSENIRALFDKYGTADLYEKISRSLGGSR
jgi:predicted nucleotidyltransferase